MAKNLHGQRVLDSSEVQAEAISEVNHRNGTSDIAFLITKPDNTVSTLVFDVEVGDFRVRPGDFSVLGSDVVVNGDFAADTDWTKGIGWTIAAGVGNSDATQTADSDLEQTLAADTLIEGESYTVSFTVSNYVAGNITPVIGGTEGTDRSADGAHTEDIVAGSTQAIALRADLDFDGDVDDFTVQLAVLTYTATPVENTSGAGSVKLRTNDRRTIPAPSTITVIGSASGDILTYYWV